MDYNGDAGSGLYALSAGYLLVSLFWSAAMLFMIEREFSKVRFQVPTACSAYPSSVSAKRDSLAS